MTDRPLSEEIEQADAGEFERYAYKLADIIVPPPCPSNEYDRYLDYETKFCIQFDHCLKHKESHIAAAIMLAKAHRLYFLVSHGRLNENEPLGAASITDKDGNVLFTCEAQTDALALLVAIAKKLEAENA